MGQLVASADIDLGVQLGQFGLITSVTRRLVSRWAAVIRLSMWTSDLTPRMSGLMIRRARARRPRSLHARRAGMITWHRPESAAARRPENDLVSIGVPNDFQVLQWC